MISAHMRAARPPRAGGWARRSASARPRPGGRRQHLANRFSRARPTSGAAAPPRGPPPQLRRGRHSGAARAPCDRWRDSLGRSTEGRTTCRRHGREEAEAVAGSAPRGLAGSAGWRGCPSGAAPVRLRRALAWLGCRPGTLLATGQAAQCGRAGGGTAHCIAWKAAQFVERAAVARAPCLDQRLARAWHWPLSRRARLGGGARVPPPNAQPSRCGLGLAPAISWADGAPSVQLERLPSRPDPCAPRRSHACMQGMGAGREMEAETGASRRVVAGRTGHGVTIARAPGRCRRVAEASFRPLGRALPACLGRGVRPRACGRVGSPNSCARAWSPSGCSMFIFVG